MPHIFAIYLRDNHQRGTTEVAYTALSFSISKCDVYIRNYFLRV